MSTITLCYYIFTIASITFLRVFMEFMHIHNLTTHFRVTHILPTADLLSMLTQYKN